MTGWAGVGPVPFVNADGSINVVVISGGSTTYPAPFIANISAPISGIEYLQTFPATVKRFMVRTRGASAFKIAYVPGDTASGNHINIRSGCYYAEQSVSTNLAINIYIQTTKNNEIIEVLYWA
jgi:hypothetical protein